MLANFNLKLSQKNFPNFREIINIGNVLNL